MGEVAWLSRYTARPARCVPFMVKPAAAHDRELRMHS
jgi:hypothetical protein